MYTKGEWEYKHFTGEIEARLLGDNGFVKICDIAPQDIPSRMLANARLIASAPDLYEALKSLLGNLEVRKTEYCLCDTVRGKCWYCEMLEPSVQALAKAEGK